jgi:hypothetical protein
MAKEGYLLRRLVDGLAGWSTYEQARKGGDKIETDLDVPLSEVARGRQWNAKRQQKLARDPGAKGGPREADFVFWRKAGDFHGKAPGLLLVEVKCIRGGKSASGELSRIEKDIKRLQTIRVSDLEGSEDFIACGSMAKFLLIAAQRKAFSDVRKIKTKNHAKIAGMIRKAWRLPGKDVYYAIGNTYLKPELDWYVYAFGKRSWPKM